MDQKDLLKTIGDREESLAAEHERKNVILTNLGQALFEDRGTWPGELFTEVDETEAEIRDLEESLRILLAEEDGRKNRNDEVKTLKVEVRNLNSRQEAAFEDLGRVCWDAWKSGRHTDPEMAELLEDINRADARLHDAEVAAFRNESGADSGRKSIFTRGRSVVLAGRKRTASASMDRLWGKAGRRIFDNMDLTRLADTPASPVLAVLEGLQDRLGEIISRQQEIAAENEILEKRLAEMPGKGPVRKRVSWLEDAIDECRSRLDGLFGDVGRRWMETDAGSKATGDVARCRQDLAAVAGTIQALEGDLEALRAHRVYRTAEADRDRKAARVHRLEQDIRERQTQLKLEKKELTAIDRDLAKKAESLPPLPEKDETGS